MHDECCTLADGATDPAALAALADQRLRATPEQLRDALGACAGLNPVYRRVVKMALTDLQLIEQQIGQLDQEMASLLHEHQDAVQRLAEVPGLGVDSAQQIIAEVGAKAATFASPKNLVSWVGACPGDEESDHRTTIAGSFLEVVDGSIVSKPGTDNFGCHRSDFSAVLR